MSVTKKGASLVEYGLLAGFIAVTALGAVGNLGDEIKRSFDWASEGVRLSGGSDVADGTHGNPPSDGILSFSVGAAEPTISGHLVTVPLQLTIVGDPEWLVPGMTDADMGLDVSISVNGESAFHGGQFSLDYFGDGQAELSFVTGENLLAGLQAGQNEVVVGLERDGYRTTASGVLDILSGLPDSIEITGPGIWNGGSRPSDSLIEFPLEFYGTSAHPDGEIRNLKGVNISVSVPTMEPSGLRYIVHYEGGGRTSSFGPFTLEDGGSKFIGYYTDPDEMLPGTHEVVFTFERAGDIRTASGTYTHP